MLKTKTVIRNLTMGLHCKACDAQLTEAAFDPELCPTCYAASCDLFDVDKDNDTILVEALGGEEYELLQCDTEDW